VDRLDGREPEAPVELAVTAKRPRRGSRRGNGPTAPPAPLSIEWLFAGTTPQRFLADWFEREVMHLGGRPPNHYDPLLRLADLDALLCQSVDPASRHLAITRAGENYLAQTDRPSSRTSMFRDAFTQGYTIALTAAHAHWLPIARLVRAAVEWLTCRSRANLFLTPPGNQGFPRHFDVYDALLLQLDGQKEWRIYEPMIDLPLEHQWYKLEPEAKGEPSRILTLRPGDLAYLPRGIPHEAVAGDSTSLHLTMTLEPYVWRDFLIDLIDEVAEQELPLRRAARITNPFVAKRAAQPEIVREILAAAAPASAADVMERARQRLVSELDALPTDLFPQQSAKGSIAADDHLQRSPGAIASVRRSRDGVMLSFPGDTLRAPKAAEGALRFMASQEAPFSIRSVPGPLSEAAKLTLANRLVRIGFLVIVESPDHSRPALD
jgi:hypothetical protein